MSAALDHLTIPQGAIIECPNEKCKDRIGRVVRSVKPGDKMTSDMFDQSGQGVAYGARPVCKKCGHRWIVAEVDLFRIKTARGWFPSEPAIVEAANS